MVIAMAGDRLTEMREREAYMDILKKMETEHGWSTGRAQRDLMESWGWEG